MLPGAATSRGAALPERPAQRRHALRHVAEGRRIEIEIGEDVEGAGAITGAFQRIRELVHHVQTLFTCGRSGLGGALQPLDALCDTTEPHQETSELGRRLHELDRRLQPELLFAGLDQLEALVQRAPAEAETFIAELGDRLRHSLAGSPA